MGIVPEQALLIFVSAVGAPVSGVCVTAMLPSTVPPSRCSDCASGPDWPGPSPVDPPVPSADGVGVGEGATVGQVSAGTQANCTSYAMEGF
ncbi:hypothetical protein SMICM304S_05417 [Streptomyces microflavus]